MQTLGMRREVTGKKTTTAEAAAQRKQENR
jgi:hypothetical protein